MSLVLILLFLPLFHHQPYASSTILNAITPTDSLRHGDVLISNESNTFALGFFTFGNSSSPGGDGNHYLGIWYNKVSIQTIIWVANRDRPITTSDGTLSLTKNGNLILTSRNITVWSTNVTLPSKPNTVTAKLLDSGNLVILSDGSGTWQSFDYPTHMYVPGMKLGFNRKSGLNWSLTSWNSPDDPGTGITSFRIDPDGSPELLLYGNGDTPLWRSGPWVGDRWSGFPRMTRSSIFDYAFIDNIDEVYLTIRVRNASVLYHLFVDASYDMVRIRTWDQGSSQWAETWFAPEDDCARYGNCGGFSLCNPNRDEFECSCFPGYYPKYPKKWNLRDGSGGCARNKSMISMCHNGEGFLKLANVKVPDTSSAFVNKTMGIEDCGKVCLTNCSCLGYTSNGGENGRGCILFYGDLIDTRQFSTGGGQDVYYRVDAVELAKASYKSAEVGDHHAHNKKLLVLILIPVCCALMSIALIWTAYWFLKKKRIEWRDERERSLWLKDIKEQDETDVPVFEFGDIVEATKGFSNQLGQGGFGAVFKGTLSNGQEIAVKRLGKNSGQGMTEFKNEVRLIAKLQHKNLVKTLGCCIRGEEKMLVYECLPNKSLDKYIFGEEEKRKLLNWRKRYDIILGIARGLLYLHQDSRLKIIHRDLKASNVLLDSGMDPKISDFGIARIFGTEQIEASTNRVIGTYGYMSPEYTLHGLISTKLDVFSFGVVALEVMSGKKNTKLYGDHEGDEDSTISLISLVWRVWSSSDGNVMEVVDPSMAEVGWDNTDEDETCFEDMILRCIQIGLLCVQDDSTERPTMSEVVFMLSNKRTELPYPKQPAFIIKTGHIRGLPRTEDPSSTSSTSGAQGSIVRDVTCTTLEAR